MKLILLQEVKKLGKKGEVIEVSEGYARNYLLPQKLAINATNVNLNTINQQKSAEERKTQRLMDEAKVMASQLGKVEVTIKVKIGEGGKIFGSVTAKDIADALIDQHGVEIDKRKIELKEAVKSLGTYDVAIKIHSEVSTQIKLHVVAS